MFSNKTAKGKPNVALGENKNRYFSITAKLSPTRESFPVTEISNDMKIKELKALAEFATGIPYHMQILRYLDEGDLLDSSDVRSNDIVPGAQLNLNVWNMWSSLVEAAGTGDIDQVFRLGVTQSTDFSTPNSEHMSSSAKSAWIADRAFTALFIAAHRGYQKLVDRLLDAGADVNGKTSLGRSPLHVAASQGHGNIVDQMLNRGADINAVDQFGDTALAVASKYNHKGCERQIFLFSWQQRAKTLKLPKEHELFAHQYFDSAFPVWLKGQPQVYYSNLLPPQEFEGSRINSPIRKPRSSSEPSVGQKCSSSEAASSAAGDNDLNNEILQNIRDHEKSGKHGMPAIQEEVSIGSGSRTQSSRRVKSSRSSPDARLKQTRSAGKSPDSKSSRSYGFSRTEKEQEVKAKSYDDWLSNKKAKEQKKLRKQKDEMETKRLMEDDKRKQEDSNEKSYDQWLSEKNPSKKKSLQGKQKQQAKNQTGSNTNLVAGGAKTGEDVLRNIIRRRAEEQSDKPSLTFDNWLMKKDLDILEEIRAGKTPLQMMIHQGKI